MRLIKFVWGALRQLLIEHARCSYICHSCWDQCMRARYHGGDCFCCWTHSAMNAKRRAMRVVSGGMYDRDEDAARAIRRRFDGN